MKTVEQNCLRVRLPGQKTYVNRKKITWVVLVIDSDKSKNS